MIKLKTYRISIIVFTVLPLRIANPHNSTKLS